MRRVLTATVAVLFLTATSASGQSPCAAPPPGATFGNGIWRVGVDIEPGTYRSSPATSVCLWYRLSGFSGTFDEKIAGGSTTEGPQVVTIDPTDAGFDSSGCGAWTKVA